MADLEAGAAAVDVSFGVDAAAPSSHDMKHSKSSGFGSGLRITFKDLTYHVPSNMNRKERAYLLTNVSGWFEPNQMAALMGPSGSGKTTLLDLLAGRKNAGVTEGQLEFGGQKPSGQFLRRYTGYVEQFDTLIGQLTVQEMLCYTAELKRSNAEPLASKKTAVDQVISKLALEGCRDVLIGSQMAKGISGGQAKRTNIGIALITNPRVLFLDEPTSGLDSYTANEVMTVVKSLVGDGVTVCATIHSPSQYCFNLFDRLMMLVKGRIVYFGVTGEAAASAIELCPKVKEMTSGYNDAEFLVDLVTEADRQGFSNDGFSNDIADRYEKSDLKARTDEQLAVYMNEDHKFEMSDDIKRELATTSSTVTPWWWGLRTLIKYRTGRNFTDPAFLGPRIGDKIFIGLLIMTLYLGKGDNYVDSNYITIASILFMMCILPAFGAAAYVPALVVERSLFVRERSDGLYYTVTYLLHKMFDELVLATCASLGMTAFVFYGVQLQGEWVSFWLGYLTTLSIGIVLAYFIAAISPNLDVANALLPTYVVTLLFFCGFLFNLKEIPPWWEWYSYIDFLRYSFGTLMVNQFGPGGSERDPPFQGTTVLTYFALNNVDKWAYLGYCSLFFIFFFCAALTTMSLKSYQVR
ncbi:hypothetical protein FOA52_016002 [Chlamydomonas sp. UWO 241]|nr:hypothetical protein FOA52_016002 [Chlamydomonas sp. UWO 241]